MMFTSRYQNKMVKPIDVKALEGYRIWIKFEDGIEGELDLSHHAGRGVFEAWNDRQFFEAVRLSRYQAIVWGDDMELCANALYMELTGKSVDEVLPVSKSVNIVA